MATLVLTVVGGVLGGPVGAALGAIAGQQIDNAIFKPKGREGPRLSDLRLQASTYGMQIPQLFGTMRVAGSVIWATDLIERRTKSGGGKGRPSVTEFSYAASFAVALSARRIGAIKRIWADGNLLRGSDGSFQERCQFRWYDGDADQAADPLIASAVGAGSGSAFRGLAYAVFEELELASFGNRIPSLTFEVEADAGAVTAGFIGGALLGEDDRFGSALVVGGYAASGDGVRAAMVPLVEAAGMRLISDGRGWRIAGRGAEGVVADLSGFRAFAGPVRSADIVERKRAPLANLPRTIQLRHYEPARDFQTGQQSAAIAGGGVREQRLDLPAALSAGAAQALATELALAASDGRETISIVGDLAALALAVGRIFDLGATGVWRAVRRMIGDGKVQIDLQRHQPLALAPRDADGGAAVVTPDWPAVPGMLRLFDLPNLSETMATAPFIMAAVAGSHNGWRGADLWWLAETEAAPLAIGTARPALALGELAAALGPGSLSLIDQAGEMVVDLINPAMELESASDAAMLAGANRAMLGEELVQFGLAVPEGAGRWRLSRLLRGRAGTDDAVVLHPVGTAFVLLDDPALLPLPSALTEAMGSGAMIEWAARGSSDLARVAVPDAARALLPLTPVHGVVRRRAGGAVDIQWIRRSRAGQAWRDSVDAPLGEMRERYRISLAIPVPGIGPWETNTAQLELAAAEVAAAAAGAAGAMLEIRQIGDFALSLPLTLNLP